MPLDKAKFFSLIKKGVESVVGIVYPCRCLVCDLKISPYATLCADCFSLLEPTKGVRHCRVCRAPLEKDQICFSCKRFPPAADHLVPIFQYESVGTILISYFERKRLRKEKLLIGSLMMIFLDEEYDSFISPNIIDRDLCRYCCKLQGIKPYKKGCKRVGIITTRIDDRKMYASEIETLKKSGAEKVDVIAFSARYFID